VIAVRRDEFGLQRDLALAGGVEIHQLGTVRPTLALERFVEHDGLSADHLSEATPAETRGHRQVGNQIHDGDRRRLVAQAPEERFEILLVRRHRHPRGDVIRSDRERDQVRAQPDRPVELAQQHVGRGRAARAQIDDARVRISGAQALVQPAHEVAAGARGADALDRAVAEGHVQHRRAAVGGQGPNVFGATGFGATGRARRRNEHGE
jgi:hypothetical protein